MNVSFLSTLGSIAKILFLKFISTPISGEEKCRCGGFVCEGWGSLFRGVNSQLTTFFSSNHNHSLTAQSGIFRICSIFGLQRSPPPPPPAFPAHLKVGAARGAASDGDAAVLRSESNLKIRVHPNTPGDGTCSPQQAGLSLHEASGPFYLKFVEYCPSRNTFCRPAASLSTDVRCFVCHGSELSESSRGRRNARFRPHPFHCYEGLRPRPKPCEPDAAPRDPRPLPSGAQPRPAGKGFAWDHRGFAPPPLAPLGFQRVHL